MGCMGIWGITIRFGGWWALASLRVWVARFGGFRELGLGFPGFRDLEVLGLGGFKGVRYWGIGFQGVGFG